MSSASSTLAASAGGDWLVGRRRHHHRRRLADRAPPGQPEAPAGLLDDQPALLCRPRRGACSRRSRSSAPRSTSPPTPSSKITLFFAAGSIHVGAHVDDVSRMDGVGRRMPWTMGAFAIGALSMIGVPPTAGFLGKWFILLAAVQIGQWFAVAVIVVSTLLNAGYFLPIVYRAFARAPDEGAAASQNRPGRWWRPWWSPPPSRCSSSPCPERLSNWRKCSPARRRLTPVVPASLNSRRREKIREIAVAHAAGAAVRPIALSPNRHCHPLLI